MELQELKRRLLRFDIDVNGFVNRNKDDVLQMNRSVQLYDLGVNAKNESIKSYRPYTPYTIRMKRKKGQPTNRVTLRDTGDFHRSFFLQFRPQEFEITANDWKTANLKFKYKPDIFGLTETNKEKLRLMLKHDIQQRIIRAIRGN